MMRIRCVSSEDCCMSGIGGFVQRVRRMSVFV